MKAHASPAPKPRDAHSGDTEGREEEAAAVEGDRARGRVSREDSNMQEDKKTSQESEPGSRGPQTPRCVCLSGDHFYRF